MKINNIGHYGDFRLLYFCDHGHGHHTRVSVEWVLKNNPDPGGYYVIDEEGYANYLPAEAFEAGYTLIEEDSK